MNISVRLSEEDKELFKAYAKINNMSMSDLVRESVMERIEDEYDLKVAEEAYEEYLKNPETTSFEDVLKELDL